MKLFFVAEKGKYSCMGLSLDFPLFIAANMLAAWGNSKLSFWYCMIYIVWTVVYYMESGKEIKKGGNDPFLILTDDVGYGNTTFIATIMNKRQQSV